MKKVLKRILWIVLGLFALILILALLAVGYFYGNKRGVKGHIERYLRNNTDLSVRIGRLDYGLFPLWVEIHDTEIRWEGRDIQALLHVDGCRADGDLRRIRRKEMPYFDRIVLDGGSIHISGDLFRARTKPELRPLVRSLVENLAYAAAAEIQGLEVGLDSEFGSLIVQGTKIHLVNRIGDLSARIELACEHIEGILPEGGHSASASLRLTGLVSPLEPSILSGDFALAELKLVLDAAGSLFQDPGIRIESRFQANEKELEVGWFQLVYPGLVEVTGAGGFDWESGWSAWMAPEFRLVDLRALANRLADFSPYPITEIDIDGEAKGRGRISYSFDAERTESSLDMDIAFADLLLGTEIPDGALKGRLTGQVQLRGPLFQPQLSGRMQIRQGELLYRGAAIQNLSLRFPFKLEAGGISVPEFSAALPRVDIPALPPGIAVRGVDLRGRATVIPAQKRLQIRELSILWPDLVDLHATADIRADTALAGEFRLKSAAVSTERLTQYFAELLPAALPDWEPQGEYVIELSGQRRHGNDPIWHLQGTLDARNIGFHAPDYTTAVESLDTRFDWRAEFTDIAENIPMQWDFGVTAGEALWRDYYLNIDRFPLSGKTSATVRLKSHEISDLRVQAVATGLGEISYLGEFGLERGLRLQGRVAGKRLDLENLYRLLFAPDIAPQVPVKFSGQAAFEGNVWVAPNLRRYQGVARIRSGQYHNPPKETHMEDVSADIPFFYDAKIPLRNTAPVPFFQKGSVSVRRAQMRDFVWEDLELDFYAAPNMFLTDAVRIPFLGGSALFDQGIFTLSRGIPRLSGISSFRLSDADIAHLPLRSKRFVLTGPIQADFHHVEILSQEIRARGQAQLDLFGGQFIIKDFAIQNPLSPGRSYRCDVDIREVDLEKMTNSIPFGRVTGVLDGDIEDLSIAYGQPASFSMRLESVKRKGVKQRFSLKAVDDLSVISSGAGFASSNLLTRFVSDFRYDKIGILCTLKNDIFQLNGTMKDKDGGEILVKRSWLFGISVVHKKPRNHIRFKDMLNRLRRVGRQRPAQGPVRDRQEPEPKSHLFSFRLR